MNDSISIIESMGINEQDLSSSGECLDTSKIRVFLENKYESDLKKIRENLKADLLKLKEELTLKSVSEKCLSEIGLNQSSFKEWIDEIIVYSK